ncbi:MAG: efflux RND transporter periplasmic adaptor subunit [Desulfovibrio sp.]|nr:efflux RND transporter periplasmic adaptor subunit [Desulfovibrio sp.]MBI4959356.1 efflux RND transporter periplasmic adaptor subunit [Desulfovibrio sp.]
MFLHPFQALTRLFIFFLLCAACGGCGQNPPPAPKARAIEAETRLVRVEEVVECRSFPAQVEARNSIILASKLSGAVVEIFAKEGANLRAGDPILRIDDKDLQSREQGLTASMAQASSERQAIAAKASHAKANLDRLEKLLAQKFISQDDYERSKTEHLALKREEEAIAARERAVAAQKEELKALGAYTRINAPFSGVLTRRYVDQGAFVNAGQPLAQMDDVTSGFDLTAQVDESLLPSLKTGLPVVGVVPSLSPEPFAAAVSAVVARVDPATRTFRLKAEPPSGTRLAPNAGMYGRLFIPSRVSKKLLLPVECLRMRGDLPSVFVADAQGVVSFRVIKPGGRFIKVMLDGKPFLTDSEAFGDPAKEAFVEVLSGLSGEERVVCSKTETLREGDRIAGVGQ